MSNTDAVTVLGDAESLAGAAATYFVQAVTAARASRSRVAVALAGGSTPRAMNAMLAAEPLRSRVPWDAIDFFFGDERCVPPEHPDSNYRMTRETLFGPLGIPDAHVFRMRGEDEPHVAAAAYEKVLHAQLGDVPVFDIMFLGMGPDGHTASLFPGTLGSFDEGRSVVANFVPKFSSYRLTVTPRVITAARAVAVTAGGAEKAAALHAVLDGPADFETYPAQLAAPGRARSRWFIDVAASAKRVAAAGR